MQRILLTLVVLFSAAICTAAENSPAPSRQDAIAAFEKLNWKLSVSGYSFRKFTFFETADKIAELGIKYIEGFNFQQISKDIKTKLNPATMSDEEINTVKAKLDSAGLKLIALYYGSFPADEAACRRVFERSKMLGVKYFVSEPDPAILPMLDKCAQEYAMIVGLHGHSKKSSPNTWHPELVLKRIEALSPAIGAFSDTGHWIRSELYPSEGAAILKDRNVGVELHDLHEFNSTGHDVPLGTGVGKIADYLRTMSQVKKSPFLISVDYTSNPDNPSDDIRKCIEFVESTAINLCK
jgi:sugar phosphate isomerase/epimerase